MCIRHGENQGYFREMTNMGISNQYTNVLNTYIEFQILKKIAQFNAVFTLIMSAFFLTRRQVRWEIQNKQGVMIQIVSSQNLYYET